MGPPYVLPVGIVLLGSGPDFCLSAYLPLSSHHLFLHRLCVRLCPCESKSCKLMLCYTLLFLFDTRNCNKYLKDMI
ncbi:hypothetical protein OESDEN_06113 [Oesophagostomum dentatum]|uniref:Uncharacterized protein n=1 Tax=Oesophagostomum dentatum TaxID=61180 RepID=A0A0B1TEZ2_OESDE|nr:hypothetical protein OESDEN_06113 [Oesophagostomum dentatum]